MLAKAEKALANFRLSHTGYMIATNNGLWDEATKAQEQMLSYLEAYTDLYTAACRMVAILKGS